MRRPATLSAAVLLLALLLLTGCTGGDPDSAQEDTGDTDSSLETTSGETGEGAGGNTGPIPETTRESGTTDGIRIEQVSSGSGGLEQRQVVVAPSADALSEATGAKVRDAGEGTYLAAFWGKKPTGGYTMKISSARTEGSRIVVQLNLEKPPPDAMVSQALTYPYAAAVLRGVDPGEKEFVFLTQNGRELDWPVRNV